MSETIAAQAPRALSLLRIIMGLMIIQHGMAKIIGFPVVANLANLNPLSLIGAAGFIELIGGALLILGLLTRPVAFIISVRWHSPISSRTSQKASTPDQRRHAGDHVLLHLSLSVDGRRRSLERRRRDEARLRGTPWTR